MKITITYEIEVPDKSTHYYGEIDEDPTFVKKTIDPSDGWIYWWYWNNDHQGWVLDNQGHKGTKPHWIKTLHKKMTATKNES